MIKIRQPGVQRHWRERETVFQNGPAGLRRLTRKRYIDLGKEHAQKVKLIAQIPKCTRELHLHNLTCTFTLKFSEENFIFGTVEAIWQLTKLVVLEVWFLPVWEPDKVLLLRQIVLAVLPKLSTCPGFDWAVNVELFLLNPLSRQYLMNWKVYFL